jgi:hypothetical protein
MTYIRSIHVRLMAVLLLGLSLFGLAPSIPTASAVATYVPISSHTCVTHSFQYHSTLIYAYPSDKPNQEATEVPRILEQFARAQDTLYASAKRRGVLASYKMLCNAQLQPEVVVVQLPTPSAATSFDTITTDLRAYGYNLPTTLYWVDFDGSWTACGKANAFLHDIPGSTNAHNQGNRFAVSFREPSTNVPCNVLQHESAHAMGAVQASAPHAVPGGHCADGGENDILCNGTQPCLNALPTNPNAKAFDCNNDDYFDPHPPTGTYLTTHWNLGGCAQHWIELSSCPSELGTVTYDSAHPAITYTGSWTHNTGVPNTMGGTLSVSSQINAGASLTFEGSSITVFYSMGPTADRMSVFIDGQGAGIQAHNPDNRRQVAFTYDNLGAGQHTILILHSPTNNGTTSLDGFAVTIGRVGAGSYDNTHAQLRYSGAWTHTTAVAGAVNSTISRSQNATDTVRFTFVGNTLWYVYDKGPDHGVALVTIDGVPQANIDQYSSVIGRPREVTYWNLGPGVHVVSITQAGAAFITIDRFVVEP